MKKHMTAIIIGALILCTVAAFIYIKYVKPDDAGRVVYQPYIGHQTAGYEDILNSSHNFDLGINPYGEPVFIDRNKAYEQLLVTCKQGIAATKKSGNLPEISKNTLGAYASSSMDVSESSYSKDTVHQAAFIGIFYDFYCHGNDR